MEQIQTEGIGEISGLCACFSHKTLNDRGYDQIYRRLLDGEDYRYNKMMERGGILCELGHPAQESADFERTETDPSKACCILTEITEGDDGKVYGKGRILDTPNGRILKAISPFYQFGFSSRGSYDAVDDSMAEGPDGWNQDSYQFKGFDVVMLPANEESIAAVESFGKSKKKRKSARESLDLNELASATDIPKEEIEKELDKLFNEDGEIEGSELVDMSTYVKDSIDNKETQENASEVNQEIVEVTEEKPVEAPLESIKTDLETALAEAAKTKQELETANFNLANLQSENAQLRGELEAMTVRAEAAEKTVQDYEQIKELSKKLLDSYDGLVDYYDTQEVEQVKQIDTANSKVTELEEEIDAKEEQLGDNKKKLERATEELEKYKRILSSTKKELASAKESIIDLQSSRYGVSRRKLSQAVQSQPISKIKSAAESLAKESLRLSSYVDDSLDDIMPISDTPAKESYTGGLEAFDSADAELIAMLKEEFNE